MVSLYTFHPADAEPPTSNFPQPQNVNTRPVLSFDAATEETCYWSAIAPQGMVLPLTAVISFMMASATTGEVIFNVALEAISDGDAFDLDAGESFDTNNGSGEITVPGTAGHIKQVAITLTNNDGIAAGDYFRLRLQRDADAAGDDAAGDCHVLEVELRDAA